MTLSAIATATAIARGETSARAEAEAAIARIEELDGPVNAVVVRDFDRALTAADAADARLAAGERAPLLGVPMTVKESYDIAGLPTSWGYAEHADHIARADSAVVRRLKAAGAVILGKTNVPVALADWQAFNPVYGRTSNPHDLTRSPGGSSGGSAAALASGMVALEYGSDIGGSIRIPAAFCGVWGHKPSFGLVPMEGHYFPRTEGARVVMSVCGPLANNPADLALALELTIDHPVASARLDTLKGARIALLDRHPYARVEPDVAAVVTRAAAACANAGAIVSRDALWPDLTAMTEAYLRLLGVALARGLAGPGQTPATLIDWFDMMDVQARFRRQWARLFEDFDIVLAPVAGIPAFPHDDEPQMAKRTLVFDGEVTPFGAQLAWPALGNYTNLPGTAFPAGATASGLPVGLQALGPLWGDLTTIRAAELIFAALA